MCSNDYDYETISNKQVKTRKPQTCSSCEVLFIPGTIMRRFCGKVDGDICTGYACQVCDFAYSQPDHSPLHLCWGWNWDGRYHLEGGGEGSDLWKYLHYCLTNNETPTATGWAGVRDQHRAAEYIGVEE